MIQENTINILAHIEKLNGNDLLKLSVGITATVLKDTLSTSESVIV